MPLLTDEQVIQAELLRARYTLGINEANNRALEASDQIIILVCYSLHLGMCRTLEVEGMGKLILPRPDNIIKTYGPNTYWWPSPHSFYTNTGKSPLGHAQLRLKYLTNLLDRHKLSILTNANFD